MSVSASNVCIVRAGIDAAQSTSVFEFLITIRVVFDKMGVCVICDSETVCASARRAESRLWRRRCVGVTGNRKNNMQIGYDCIFDFLVVRFAVRRNSSCSSTRCSTIRRSYVSIGEMF
jgi:hypothetical protein